MNPSFSIGVLREDEIDALLALQAENAVENIDPQTKAEQGFISFRYSPEIMRLKMSQAPQIIARDGDLIVGYALVTTIEVARQIPDFLPFIENTKLLSGASGPLEGRNPYFIGQICVKYGYRGLGIVGALYRAHREKLHPPFDCAITEIASDNTRSLAAHAKVGFDVIYTYYDDYSQKEWQVVMMDFTKQQTNG
jgi:ribosomal protein S18 acetylase RimI-like enzyme